MDAWEQDWIRVRLSGALVSSTASTLRNHLSHLNGRRIKLDLSDVTTVDERGHAVLLGAERRFELDGRVLLVLDPKAVATRE
jgi:ABC-type transporter Mla MlaB component